MKQRSIQIDFILLCLVVIFNIYFTQKNEKFAKNNVTTDKPLYDIGHKLLIDTSKFRIINDIIPFILGLFAFFSPFRTNLVNSIILGIFIRMFTIYSTILPVSTTNKCNFDGSFIGGCYDKIFSGHMTINILSSIVLFKQNNNLLYPLIFLNVIAGLLIISSRDHYTIDVILGIILSLFIGSRCINNNQCYI